MVSCKREAGCAYLSDSREAHNQMRASKYESPADLKQTVAEQRQVIASDLSPCHYPQILGKVYKVFRQSL